MYGEWRIDSNRANRGGGVFLHGNNAPHTYVLDTGWIPHPDKGVGTLIMHGGRFYDNWSYTSGGGVYIYNDARFEMRDGQIDSNASAIYGGGVYVLNPGRYFTSRFDVIGGQITRNRAIFGGGVYLMFRAQMSASNALFAGNHAQRMGGAIFTELIDYGTYLSGMDIPHDLFPTLPDSDEVFQAFNNLNIAASVRFTDEGGPNPVYGNNSAFAAFHPPYNAEEMLPDIRWLGWDSANPRQHLSTMIHPLNNYDINFVRPIYFYKTDMGIYYNPRVINNQAGAVFALDIQKPHPTIPGEYIWELYTQATSEANGRVTLFVFTPGHFRLREVTPPPGFILPPAGHHWYLDMDIEIVESAPDVFDAILYMVDPPPQHYPEANELRFIRLDRENAAADDEDDAVEARMRWHVGNLTPSAYMYLHKADAGLFGISTPTQVSQIQNMLLEGAVFALYRYTGTGTPASAEVPAPGWVQTQVLTSTNDPLDPMRFRLNFRADGQAFSYYQLVEVMAPPGYVTPLGQWRFRMDVVDFVLNQTSITVLESQGAPIPPLIPLTGETGHVFTVGNSPNFDLPLSGGMGAGMRAALFTSAGIMVIIVGLAAIFMPNAKKKIAVRAASSRYNTR